MFLKIPPRGDERNSVNNDSNITYNSDPVKRWPESGPDSAKTPKISNQTDSDLVKIIEVWCELPEHIKQTIRTIVAVTNKEKSQ